VNKQAPTISQIATMVMFALSCFCILLFIWLTFGGSSPLKAEGYAVKVAFPEAVQLGADADVRSSGITIGTVRRIEQDRASKRTLATLVLDSKHAPLASDARAILRTKTLLGETFVELTQGSREAPKLKEGGRLADARVGETVELDELFQTYDPTTRRAFRMWQQDLSVASADRGEDLNNVLGHLPEFTQDANGLLEVLDRNEDALTGLIRDTGEVYGALSVDERQLRNLTVNSDALFRQTASQREALATAFQIFPTFLRESRTTLARLERFSANTRPLVRDLRPVSRELTPTIRAVRGLAPDLKQFFRNFDQQITASKTGLPALRDILRGARPLVGSVWPFLQEFNPIFEWLELNQNNTADFLQNGPSGLADTTPSANPGEPGHYLRQLTINGTESAGIHPNRLSTNRGNAYLPPIVYSAESSRKNTVLSFDCKPSGGEVEARPGTGGNQACLVAPRTLFKGKQQGQFPHVDPSDYAQRGR